MRPLLLFYALAAVWALGELWLGHRRRSADTTRSRDGGTLPLLLVVLYASVALAIWAGIQGLARFPAPWRTPLFWLGLAMMAGGLVLRWWSIRVLARFFTVDVTIQPDHQLIRRGPYRWLRHPSYTGALLTFYGCGLALGSAVSALVMLLPVTLVFLRRILHEERVLAEAFPGQYPAYAKATKRLFPFLW